MSKQDRDQPKVRISKPLGSAPWRVDCDTCGSDWPFSLQPWAFVRDWSTALLLAHWHLQVHAEQRCAHCGHVPSLERLKPLDSPGLFKAARITEVAPGRRAALPGQPPVIWARTAAGRLMPLDANSDGTLRTDPGGNVAARLDGHEIAARVLGGDLLSSPDLEAGEIRAMPHFASCPGWSR